MALPLLVAHRGGAGPLVAGLVAPDGAHLLRAELPVADPLAVRLATRLVAAREPAAALVLRHDPQRRDVGLQPVHGGPLGVAELEEELGWLGLDVRREGPDADPVAPAVVLAGAPVMVALALRPDCPHGLRAAQLVLDVLAERLPWTTRRARRPAPLDHALRCRPVRQLR